MRDLRTRLFDHLQGLSIGFYDRNAAGILISPHDEQRRAARLARHRGVNQLVTSALTIVGAITILFFLDLELALVSLAAVPLLLAGTWVYGRLSGPVYRAGLNTVGDVTDYMQESLAGGRVVRTYVQQDRHRRGFDEVNAKNADIENARST